MRIAFYAPLKSPNHPVPSGDRQMARLLMKALRSAGHHVELVSELRSFSATPDADMRRDIAARADAERSRLAAGWRQGDMPDVWFTYHPYYKAPDLIGPPLAEALGIAYVTAEASYSERRNDGGWRELQAPVRQAVGLAALNLCFTARDLRGLAEAVPGARTARLLPFIDIAPFSDAGGIGDPRRLVTVAMMRSGDKLESYARLASALQLIENRPWRLSVIGDGPQRAAVEAMFARFEPGRIEWRGELGQEDLIGALAGSGLYVWPGVGEAYGIAYLEAQAAGLPVIAQSVAGVPEVVVDGRTGRLTADGDTAAYAAAIAALLDDPAEHAAMSKTARHFVATERSLEVAAKRLDQLLQSLIGDKNDG
ncbi:glycosyltransferase family 4 protein [Phyllobacterium sp. 0TCS1.6C]|uniref:glycosyltransferase family 4 protein n=1 Tax=unclassified Phyllobacterium TaxID=2638441 RepID=UPI002263FB8F|nr:MULTISPECIES: glycosyltransferase family 4 protein [unclassified Phyllobacterium]MCX8280969.1 glycosyltransferase family 4 protein [Phyllobacterium sp. 0TCS1.6C]MCX8295835.1 glycosyltransferase family 4 protein [Phyllobacterium sp. 0TCS1.6A]